MCASRLHVVLSSEVQRVHTTNDDHHVVSCDLRGAAALAALFFEASGGDLAEHADEICETQGIAERWSRLGLRQSENSARCSLLSS